MFCIKNPGGSESGQTKSTALDLRFRGLRYHQVQINESGLDGRAKATLLPEPTRLLRPAGLRHMVSTEGTVHFVWHVWMRSTLTGGVNFCEIQYPQLGLRPRPVTIWMRIRPSLNETRPIHSWDPG